MGPGRVTGGIRTSFPVSLIDLIPNCYFCSYGNRLTILVQRYTHI